VRPILRLIHQSSSNRVQVHVAQLLLPLFWVMDVEVVVTRLPERPLLGLDRDRQFHRLNGLREQREFRLVHHQVNVFGHQDVTGDDEAVTQPHRLKRLLEERLRRRRLQKRLAAIAAPGQVMKAAGVVIAHQSLSHNGKDNAVCAAPSQVSEARPGAPKVEKGHTWATRLASICRDCKPRRISETRVCAEKGGWA